jgi:2-dehydropantoate 2-reductase
MKIAIIGAGGVGGYFGGRIAQGGGDVIFVARGRQGEALRKNGLTIRSPSGDVVGMPVTVVEHIADIDSADVAIIAVKLWDTEQVARDLLQLAASGTTVVSLQNGVSKDETLRTQLPPNSVIGGLCYIASVIEEPGIIRHSGTLQRLVVGEFDGQTSKRVEAFVKLCCASQLDAETSPEIERLIWEKFVFLVALSATTCAIRQPIGVVRADPNCRTFLHEIIAEAAAVARSQGVNLDEGFEDERLAYIDTLPAEMISSMRHDLEHGNRLELDWLSADVVRRGRLSDVPTPMNKAVTAVLSPYAAGRAA